MIVLAAAKAGRGSKKVHALVELLKFQTRTRLSASNRGANPMTGSTTDAGVGVGVGVGVAGISDLKGGNSRNSTDGRDDNVGTDEQSRH